MLLHNKEKRKRDRGKERGGGRPQRVEGMKGEIVKPCAAWEAGVGALAVVRWRRGVGGAVGVVAVVPPIQSIVVHLYSSTKTDGERLTNYQHMGDLPK